MFWKRVQLRLIFLAGVVCACAIRAAELPPAAPSPASSPATQPALASIKGKVSISGGFGFQKPDLSRVVVYIASDPRLDAQPTTRATVSQRNKAFTPNFVVIPRGTEVEFPNWDKFDHNVFSRSAAAPAFDLDRYPYGKSKTRTFEKLGVVQVFCNIHPQMRAVIYVTPNRYFARADDDGNFEIKDVPPGTYDVVAWNERCDEQKQTVEIKDGIATELNFALNESHDRAISSSDTGRKNYGGIEKGLGVKREKLNLPVVTDVHDAPPDSKP